MGIQRFPRNRDFVLATVEGDDPIDLRIDGGNDTSVFGIADLI